MPAIPAEADIRCPAEQIFDVITDFRGQERWLAKSSAFRGTTEISSDPVTLGTTYREPGPFGVRARTLRALKAFADTLASLPGLLF